VTGKCLGEAVTEAEQALERAVARVAHWPAEMVRYRPVSGGITNINWRVDVGANSYFVKIPGRGTELFIDRAVALDAATKAHRLGVGPKVHAFLADFGIEVANFVTDRRAGALGDFQDMAVCASVIDAYRALHAAAPLTLTKTVFDMIDEHRAQITELGGWRPHDEAWLLDQVEAARSALTQSGLDLVPCFNDPMPGNFLVGADKSVMLIDYEYASNNDRAYDLGAWFGEMFLTPDQEEALVARYRGGPDPAMLARARIHKALADIKWASWSMVQERISDMDFDYRKYGVWKYMRARAVMCDPRWPDWLGIA
jgi:thiamine kinase-like enzyme